MKLINIGTKFLEHTIVKVPFLKGIYNPYYKKLVNSEVQLAQIKEDDNVLCIGGGPTPITAVYIQKYTKASVTVVDNDFKCHESSNKYLRSLDLNDKIGNLCIDGCKFNCFKNYNVIHIAKQVSPKKEIVQAILNKCEKGTKIIVRATKKEGEELCQICFVKMIKNRFKLSSSSILLIK